MFAQLLDLNQLVLVLLDHVQSQKFQETVTVLWSKLNSELQIFFCFYQIVMWVLWMVSHSDSSTFTPYFS